MMILFSFLFADVFIVYACCIGAKRADQAMEKIKQKKNDL